MCVPALKWLMGNQRRSMLAELKKIVQANNSMQCHHENRSINKKGSIMFNVSLNIHWEQHIRPIEILAVDSESYTQ